MRNLDFSSWQALLSTFVGLAVITLIGVGIRLLAMQTVQQRRERENRQINERLRTLIAAYKTLGGSFTGNLAVDPTHLRDLLHREPPIEASADAGGSGDRGRRVRDAVEAALSDIILLGTEEQVELAAHAAAELAAGRPTHTDALVVSLRNFIRKVLDLEPVPVRVAIPKQGPARVIGARGKSEGGGKGEGGSGGGKGGGGGGMGGGAMGAGLGLGGGMALGDGHEPHSWGKFGPSLLANVPERISRKGRSALVEPDQGASTMNAPPAGTRLASLLFERPSRFSGWAPLVLRLVIGGGFMQHGFAKLLRGPEMFAGILAAIGVPAPELMAWLTVAIEILGGFAIVIGAFVTLASIPMIVVLLVATFTVHLPYGFSSIKLMSVQAGVAHFGQPGYECDLLYLAGLVALVLSGAGPWSVDRAIARVACRTPGHRGS